MNRSPSIATAIVSDYLLPGEQLLWAGRPKQGFTIRAVDFLTVPFVLCWSAFLVFVISGLIKQEEQLNAAAIAMIVTFILFGLNALLGRFWIEARFRSKIFYGVTNYRIIIVSGLTTSKANSINLKDLLDVQFTRRSDGTGTIEFFTSLGGHNRFRKLGFNRTAPWWPINSIFIPPAFEMIPDARQVCNMIIQLRDEARQTG